jgi:hypothetical protein
LRVVVPFFFLFLLFFPPLAFPPSCGSSNDQDYPSMSVFLKLLLSFLSYSSFVCMASLITYCSHLDLSLPLQPFSFHFYVQNLQYSLFILNASSNVFMLKLFLIFCLILSQFFRN